MNADTGPLPVIYSARATLDVALAKAWLDDVAPRPLHSGPSLGTAFVQELDELARRLVDHPFLYAPFRGTARRAVMHRFDYAVVYRVLPEAIQIVGVLHCRLDPQLAVERAEGTEKPLHAETVGPCNGLRT